MERREFLRNAGLGALALMAPATLTACTSSSTPAKTTGTPKPTGTQNAKQITLDFPSWQVTETGVDDWWKEAVSKFQATNPNITINMSQVPYGSYVDTLTTRFSAGKPPDIVHLPTGNFGSFASQDWLANLDERLADTDIIANWTDIQKTLLWDSHYIGVLLLGYAPVLYYNEQMLQNAGVSVPTTTSELIDASKKLTGNGLYGYGATTSTFPTVYQEMTWYAYGAGGSWSKGQDLTFTDASTLEGMDNYRATALYAPKGVSSEQITTLFFDGKVAMVIAGPFTYVSIPKANPSVAPHLKVAAAPFTNQPGGPSNSIHIAKDLEADRADAVWAFIRSLTTPEMQTEYARLYGVPAPRKGAVTKELLASQPQLGLFQSVTDRSVSATPDNEGIRSNFTVVEALIVDAGIELQTTGTQTKDVMAKLQDKVASAIKS